MPSLSEISSLTQTPPATVAAQKILAAYLSNHKLPPTAAAQLAVTLTALLKALAEGRDPAVAGLLRFVMPAALPVSASVADDDAEALLEDAALEEDEMDAAEEVPEPVEVAPEEAPRPRRAAARTKAARSVTPATPEPQPVAPKSKPAAKGAATSAEPEKAREKAARPRRAKTAAVVEEAEEALPPILPETAAEPVKAKPKVSRRKPKAAADSQILFDLDPVPDVAAESAAVAPDEALDQIAVVEVEAELLVTVEEAAPAAPEPIASEPAVLQPAAPEPAAPRPILRAPVRPPVIEDDEDYDPYLGGPMPRAAVPPAEPMAAPAPLPTPDGAGAGRKKRKRPPRPAHQRRAAREALQSGATPANGGVPDNDDDYDPLI